MPRVACRITRSHTSPENTSVAPHPPQSEPIASENITAWVYERRARMPGARASSPHTAIRPITSAPPGDAGFQPAYGDTPHHPCTVWVRGRLARMLGTRASSPHTAIHHLGAQASSPPTTPHLGARASSPHTVIHHLGARASRPHAGCTGFQPAYDAPPRSTGVQPAYSDTLHHLCTAWVRGRLARMPGAQASRPHTAIHPITPAPSGCAGVQPACRERGLPACLSDMPRLGARASSPHAGCTGIAPAYSDKPHHPCTAWVRRRRARIQRYTPSPLHRMGARASSPHAAS